MGSDSEEERLKELIIKEAAKGRFNNNPLLSRPHPVTCDKCRHTSNITYLDYLKRGQFRIGRPRTIETEGPLGAFMAIDEENVTPIVLELTCEHCGEVKEVEPLTVEYLMVVANRSEPSKIMFA